MDLSYLIISRAITPNVISRINILLDRVSDPGPPEIVVVTGESPPKGLASNLIRVIYDQRASDTWWKKIIAARNYDFRGSRIVLMADDDLNFIAQSDLSSWDCQVKCGQSRHLMVVPRGSGRFTLFDGWTQFFSAPAFHGREEQVANLIGEGPCSVYSTYSRDYFNSTANLVSELGFVLSRVQGWDNIIEDCINLSNLVVGVRPLFDSTIFRVLNAPSIQKRGYKLSSVVLSELEREGVTKELSDIVLRHVRKNLSFDERLTYSADHILDLLQRHTNGYAGAASRKWRSWIDIEFYPFATPDVGLVIPAGGHKFNPVFYWGGRGDINPKTFPEYSFMSRDRVHNLIKYLPDSYWHDIDFTGSTT